jgi:hypothetical protein
MMSVKSLQDNSFLDGVAAGSRIETTREYRKGSQTYTFRQGDHGNLTVDDLATTGTYPTEN